MEANMWLSDFLLDRVANKTGVQSKFLGGGVVDGEGVAVKGAWSGVVGGGGLIIKGSFQKHLKIGVGKGKSCS